MTVDFLALELSLALGFALFRGVDSREVCGARADEEKEEEEEEEDEEGWLYRDK